MDSPWLMAIFCLADRLGEPDPRKIASLPDEILLHWQAWLSLTGNAVENNPVPTPKETLPPVTDMAGQCADVMRILGR